MASRSLTAVVAEATQLAESGIREVVVTGVCVGAYADESSGARLPDLLSAVALVPGIARVRLSSLQPIETGDDLIDQLVRHSTLCPHLHLSLQSGDDTVLARMQRPYDTAYYRDLVARLRRRIPRIAITTDIIVGFPGESETLFDNTLRFAAEIGFSRAHIFRYSPRERTYAANTFRDEVEPEEKERRHKVLSEVCRRSQVEFAQRYIGEWVRVIIEGRGKAHGLMSGYTDTYVRTHFPGGAIGPGQLIEALIAEVGDDGDAFAYDVRPVEQERSRTI
jgi:threonylcarbamoyladenosine tRNA methylthiotransferase MtaB